MHINIILGLLVIAALVWLVSRARSARRDPAKIMRREINRKQEEAETLEKAEATLQALRASRLKELETAIARMIQGIEREDRRPAVGRDSASGCITITLPSYSGLPSNIGSGDSQGQRRVADAPCRLDWNVSDFNVHSYSLRGIPLCACMASIACVRGVKLWHAEKNLATFYRTFPSSSRSAWRSFKKMFYKATTVHLLSKKNRNFLRRFSKIQPS